MTSRESRPSLNEKRKREGEWEGQREQEREGAVRGAGKAGTESEIHNR